MDNPWIGLCSYQEGQQLYGRDVEIREISTRIQFNTQTVIYGKSGIGKTSIMNAGVFPRFRSENILPMYIRLQHDNTPYTQQIIDVIVRTAAEQHIRIEEILPHPCDNENHPLFKESLWEFFHRTRFYNTLEEQIEPLIVFDQFEEIFTIAKDIKSVRSFFNELADLLNNVKPQSIIDYENSLSVDTVPSIETDCDDCVLPHKGRLASRVKLQNQRRSIFDYTQVSAFHVVFTLREDFLSYFERYTIGIPSLKQNRYCLQAINECQAAEIVRRPRKGLVDDEVTKLIIQQVTGRDDFDLTGKTGIEVDAAVLSLFLQQLYDKRQSNDDVITKELVISSGKNIIKDFYENAISGLSSDKVDFLEKELLTSENRRNIKSRADIIAGGFSKSELDYLINEKKLLRQFHFEGDFRIEFIHDILCNVVVTHRNERALEKNTQEIRIAEEKKRKTLLEEQERKEILRCVEYNRKKRAAEKNVLIHKGRRLIDNALDFGQYRTLYSYSNTSSIGDVWLRMIRGFLKQIEPFWGNADEFDFENQRVFSDPLLTDSSCVLNFYNDDHLMPTIDGLYGVEIKYCDSKISDILFRGKGILPDGSISFNEPNFIAGGYCGIHIDYDSKGLEVMRTYLGDNGQPIVTQDGYSSVKTEYDSCDNPVRVRYFNIHSDGLEPVLHIDGNHGFDSIFDQYGNEVERYFIDLNGNRTSIVSGVYGKRMTYDMDTMRLTSISNIDSSGCLMPDIDGYVTEKSEYIADGYHLKYTYFDQNGSPWKTPDGYYGTIDNFSKNTGLCISSYIDQSGNPTTDSKGVSKFVTRLNDKLQILDMYEETPDGSLFEDDGVALRVLDYNEKNHLCSCKFFDKDKRYVCGWHYELDKMGTYILREFAIGDFEKSVLSDSGVEGIEYEVGLDRNQPVLQKCINTTKQIIPNNDGIYSFRSWRDEKGRIIKQLYFDCDDSPMSDNSGIYGKRVEFITDCILKEYNLDAAGNIMEDNNGVAYVLKEETNTYLHLTFYNIHGEPHANDGWVYYLQEKEFFENGGYKETLYVQNENKEYISLRRSRKAHDTWGVIACVFEESVYDERGRLLSQYFKDIDGNLVSDDDGDSYTICDYNDDEKTVICSLYRTDNTLRSRIKKTYNNQGRIIEVVTLDESDQLLNNDYGYAGERYVYDDVLNTKTISFFDAEGNNFFNQKQGFASRQHWYDQFGRIIAQKDFFADGRICGNIAFKEFIDSDKRECAYYIHFEDGEGNLVPFDNGSIFNYCEDDVYGRKVKNLYLDLNKEPMPTEEGVFGFSITFDGDCVINTYLDINGQPCNNNSGIGIIHSYLDDKEREKKILFFSIDGTPVSPSNLEGCYGFCYEYPSDNSEIRGFLDINGNITSLYGYAYREKQSNQSNGSTQIFYYDINGNNVPSDENPEHFYGYSIEPKDEYTIVRTLGKDGNTTDNARGYACRLEVYDDGKICYHEYYDAKGNLICDEVGDFGTEYQYLYDGLVTRVLSLNKNKKPHINDYGYCCRDIISGLPEHDVFRDLNGNLVIPHKKFLRKLKDFFANVIKSKASVVINCRQIGAVYDCVLGTIEHKGSCKKFGLHDTYVIMEYNSWKFGDTINEIANIIEDSIRAPKHLILLPISLDGSVIVSLGDLIELDLPSGPIGMRFMSWSVNMKSIQLIADHCKR